MRPKEFVERARLALEGAYPKRQKPPEALGGSRRPQEAPGGPPSPSRPPKVPPAFFLSERSSRPDPDQSQADKGGEWEFRALARNPKRYKVGWTPAKAGGGKEKPTHQFLVCWARKMRRRTICRPPTPLGVSGRHIYMRPSAAARRDPKP